MENTSDPQPGSFKIVGNWEAKVKHLKASFPQLTAEDLMFLPDQENMLISRLATRLNKGTEEIKHILTLA